MKKEHKDKIAGIFALPEGSPGLEKILSIVTVKDVPAGTTLLAEGDVATNLFVVLKGCLRSYFVKENGDDITFQFFVEGQRVSSFESAMTGTPSRLNIDAIENSTIGFVKISRLVRMAGESDAARENFNRFLVSRLIYYMQQHTSFILDSPEKRYIRLVKESPELVSRLPQKYIASYLGITPVSLSRIRSRIKKQNNKTN